VTPETDPALLPAHEQVERIRAGDLSAVELLTACEARIDRHNEDVNAIVTPNPAGRSRSPVRYRSNARWAGRRYVAPP